MGCNIHLYTEYLATRYNLITNKELAPKWISADYYRENPYKDIYENEPEMEHIKLWHGQNYTQFALLADVCNYDNQIPIAQPKGIPDDLSEVNKKHFNNWDADGYSHSYFTLKELKAYFTKNPTITMQGYISIRDAKNIDEKNTEPSSYRREQTEQSVFRQWTIPNPVIKIIEPLEDRACEVFRVNTFNDEFASKIRIVFFFDS